MKIGIQGLIVDGVVRDADALEKLKLPVYSRGLSPNACNKDGAGEIGSIIACGGVAVRPGDIVVADRDGITVVPLDDAAASGATCCCSGRRAKKNAFGKSNAACWSGLRSMTHSGA